MAEGISESRFNMWRCVVGMAHADGVITPHELAFINDYIKDLPFSEEQLSILGDDLREAQDIYVIFSNITDDQDKKDFFSLARALSWCDGDYDAQEKIIIEQLEKVNLLDENQDILMESRDSVSEIELCKDQWKSKSKGDSDILGFFKGLRSEATA